MRTRDIRTSFLKFFERHNHRIIEAGSLVPTDDSSVLFTTAGMQPIKGYFLGTRNVEKDFGVKRLASVQPAFRTSDIEDVGDESHLTFFEMLGNFSLGDYGPDVAITLAWTYLTNVVHLPKNRLAATYFLGDDDRPADKATPKLWRRYLPEDRIFGFGRNDNWWGPPGPSGPCGPCTEIHFDRTGKPCERGKHCTPNDGCGRFVELWNLVFMQYEQSTRGTLKELSVKGIDTGMGIERLAMVLQQRPTVYETDCFEPIITLARKDPRFGRESALVDTIRTRVLADHLRGVVFLLAEGVSFSNKEQGYVLRRVFRRAADQFLSHPFSITPYLELLISEYGPTYPKLTKERERILEAAEQESASYEKVLTLNVADVVGKALRRHRPQTTEGLSGLSHNRLSPDEAFHIYATYGISPDRLRRTGFEFDQTAFEAEIEKHQEESRRSSKMKFGGHGLVGVHASELSDDERRRITRLHTATHLLHAALRKILGPHVRQQGSDISPERLRFDFEHPLKLTKEEKRDIENLVNEKILSNLTVTSEEQPYEQALQEGALAFFKEKYPKRVIVYTIGDFSKELCGGPHVSQTNELGTFRIIAEQSVGAGIRRIKAVVDEPTSSSVEETLRPS